MRGWMLSLAFPVLMALAVCCAVLPIWASAAVFAAIVAIAAVAYAKAYGGADAGPRPQWWAAWPPRDRRDR